MSPPVLLVSIGQVHVIKDTTVKWPNNQPDFILTSLYCKAANIS